MVLRLLPSEEAICYRHGIKEQEIEVVQKQHPDWTVKQCLTKLINRKEQAERRASHDTGYERKEWSTY